MNDLRGAKKILGMSIARDRTASTLKIYQEKFLKKVLEKFSMENAKPIYTPLGVSWDSQRNSPQKKTKKISLKFIMPQ